MEKLNKKELHIGTHTHTGAPDHYQNTLTICAAISRRVGMRSKVTATPLRPPLLGGEIGTRTHYIINPLWSGST